MKRLLGWTIASGLVLVAGTAFAKPPVPISECGTVITEPGKYRVTQDLFCLPDQRGIQVFASDVTLDLKGHTITCDTSGDQDVSAVWVGNPSDPDSVVKDVWVKNGTVSGCTDGVIFFYGQSGKVTKITAVSNEDKGIFVLEAKDTLIKNNVGFGNLTAIGTAGGIGSEIKHNVLYDNLDAAIALESGIDSLVACNTSERDEFGVRIGPESSGNTVRGNHIIDSGAVGIGVYSFGISPEIFVPMPPDNVIKKNIVQGSGGGDVAELILRPPEFGGGVFALPECYNIWKNNQYGTSFGPVDCIAPTVELDDDDVCALDDDDDSDSDSDSDSD